MVSQRRVAALGTDAHADAACDKYADPTNGNDANGGATPQQALQSPIALLNALAPGQEGCLTDGATFTLGGGDAITAAGGTPGLPITLRPTTPGARVTISAATGFEFQTAGHDIVFRDINFRRPTGGGGSLLQINGDRTTLDGVDLTYPYNICLDIGGDPRHGDTDPTEDFVLRNSRIHDCGSSYGPPHIPNDSGVHGIYAEFLRDGTDAGATSDSYSAVIEDNLIYANHNRGIQLYPDADDTLIRRNVFYGNGANVNIGSDTPTIASERNTFVDNIISESTLDGLAAGGFVGDTNEVLGNLVGVEKPRQPRRWQLHQQHGAPHFALRRTGFHPREQHREPVAGIRQPWRRRLHARVEQPVPRQGTRVHPAASPSQSDAGIRPYLGHDRRRQRPV